jgi:homoserine kinase type II
MSVYTTVETSQLEQFLTRYALGKLREFEPIAAGITNTNYYLDTETGRFVLTLYEHHSDDELDFMLGLQMHLAARSVCCSEPVIDRRGDLFSTLNQRPAAIIRRLPGAVVTHPGDAHCALIGAELARFHLAGQDYPGLRPNPRGVDWIVAVRDMLSEHLNKADRVLISTTLRRAAQVDLATLPRGAIHADLFHDNALFVDTALGGILDFDYACNDSFVFDIAVLLNDWCIDGERALMPDRVTAVMAAYQQIRPLQADEMAALPLLLQLAALRFWLSRLYDEAFPLGGELTYLKCPVEFRELLERRNDEADKLNRLFLPHIVR